MSKTKTKTKIKTVEYTPHIMTKEEEFDDLEYQETQEEINSLTETIVQQSIEIARLRRLIKSMHHMNDIERIHMKHSP